MIKLHQIVPAEPTETWGNYDFDKPSLAVVACGINNELAVLDTVGPHVRMEMEEYGLNPTDILPTPDNDGIWIWEGIGVWYPGPYEYPNDGETILEGTYRAPTDAEWEAIKSGECPWNDTEWKRSSHDSTEASL